MMMVGVGDMARHDLAKNWRGRGELLQKPASWLTCQKHLSSVVEWIKIEQIQEKQAS